MMGFSYWLPAYAKLLDKAVLTVNSRGGNLSKPAEAAEYIWERLLLKKHARGYSPALVRQIVDAQAEVPDGKHVNLPPELVQDLKKLGKALTRPPLRG